MKTIRPIHITRADRQRSERVELRVSPLELEAWERAAAAEGRTLSDWIREACAERAARETPR